jgi:hypothetical protein
MAQTTAPPAARTERLEPVDRPSRARRLAHRLFEPVDGASLAVFRILFGAIMRANSACGRGGRRSSVGSRRRRRGGGFDPLAVRRDGGAAGHDRPVRPPPRGRRPAEPRRRGAQGESRGSASLNGREFQRMIDRRSDLTEVEMSPFTTASFKSPYGLPQLEVAAERLLALDRLEQRFEVALAEGRRAVALDHLEENGRAVLRGLREDLK